MQRTASSLTLISARPAELIREYGPFHGVTAVHGLTHVGKQV